MQNLDRFRTRWFNKTTKMMMDVISLDIKGNYALVRYEFADEYTPDEEVNISDGILLQCTGFKNKNGILIYEGDVINIYGKNIIVDLPNTLNLYYNLDILYFESKIIGNIYTTPKLLNN